ncbi:MAG TPA: hypothetical protein VH679_11950 [Vicinamibacterales bacterium]|jgi:hypothetical protein
MRPTFRLIVGFATFALALGTAYCVAHLEASEQTPTVAVAALERLLPAAPAGWSKGEAKTEQVVISSDCSHPIAVVTFTQGETRVKISLADSGMHPDSLMALAPMLVMLPEGYSERIPPATKIERMQRNGVQVAERWDERKGDAEITMLVKGRFVLSGEGRHLDSLDTLRAMLDAIDLRKLVELK